MIRSVSKVATAVVAGVVVLGPAAVAAPGSSQAPAKPSPTRPVTSASEPTGERLPDATPDRVDAVIVKSYSGCGTHDVAWQEINTTWQQLGTTEVHIDYDYQRTCTGALTYQDLVSSGADVLILSDPAGALIDLTHREKHAIEQYLADGHGLLATYATFRNRHVVNHSLAATAGIVSGTYRLLPQLDPTFELLEPDNPLFANVPDPYVSEGYDYTQVPPDLGWDEEDLGANARYAAVADGGLGAIIVNDEPAYRSVYISTMPEYRGGPADSQFIYNAITYVAPSISGS